jgi:hypothetical protein
VPHPPPAAVQAIATIRIERPAIANRREWERASKSSRREIIVHDRRRQPVLVRLIEYQ